ncbi:type-F conjugative transfer system pilin assembly protein TrbC [Enterobacter hormaechei]|nr:type-F conjugative transfer system pilin assembly protein TrbC [Enterobacter hormaechei]MCE1469126.1 type-F conjugative transfer system pilin assembly protein TrbC [Enterobacter hormaechei]
MNKITGPCAGLLMSAICLQAMADTEADRAFIRDQETFSQQLRAQDHSALRDMLSQQVRQNPLPAEDTRFIGRLKQRQQEAQQDKPTHGALYFVSFAIPQAGLKRMLTEARRYDIPAMLRGMVNNDMKATADAVMSLVQEGSASGVAIDPNRYREYGITSVPSLVVYCESGHDVIRGNLRLKQALGKVAEQGDCRDEARALLEKGGNA